MAIIRTQDKVPTVYTWESRDFQLLARLFDCSFNGVKYDIDSMLNILDAIKCRANILQLVQTKVGFFTNRTIEDSVLRYVLKSFPLLVRGKGSIKAIQEAINVFLKSYGVKAEINVWYVNTSDVIYKTAVDDHTIIIGLNKAMSNLYVLEEIFRYILPIGFGFYIYFYNEISELTPLIYNNKLRLLYASANVASLVRSPSDKLDDFAFRTLGGIDVTEIASIESPVETVSGTYEPGDTSKFLGILTQEPLTGDNTYSYIKLNNDNYELYYKNNGVWVKIDYKGLVLSIPTLTEGVAWTEYSELPEPTYTSYLYINGSTISNKCIYDMLKYVNNVEDK